MKTLLLNLFVVSMTLCTSSCRDNPRLDKKAIERNVTVAQLHSLASKLGLAELETRIGKPNYQLGDLLRQATKTDTLDGLFRCQIDSRQWISLCPDFNKWRNCDDFTNEVWMVCPIAFFDKDSQSKVFLGVTFGGDHVVLKELPDWKPLAIEDLAKQLSAKL
jgi:hypothetical protein